ncbi:MAG: DUF429 domain-containing protein [Pseudonocardiaceae bacterium]
MIVEVYPAAGLKCWGLPHRRHKGNTRITSLAALVDKLREFAPWLDLGQYEQLCRQRDHAFDAVLAALLARVAALGLTIMPTDDDHATALTEGWITLPEYGPKGGMELSSIYFGSWLRDSPNASDVDVLLVYPDGNLDTAHELAETIRNSPRKRRRTCSH